MQEREFDIFFKKWYRPAMANAAKFLWTSDGLEEIVLDAFTATWQNLNKLPYSDDASRFLFFVLKRKCLNKNRDSKNRKEYSVYSMEADAEDYNLIEIGALLTVDVVERFQEYVNASCTQRQKEIMQYFMLGKNNTEIGAVLGINHRTVSTVKTRVFDAFKKTLTNEDKL